MPGFQSYMVSVARANRRGMLSDLQSKYDVPHDPEFYENTQHSFFNQQRTPFEGEASTDAWQRML
jgi:dienelactone hydrolase